MGDVSAQAFEFLALLRTTAHPRMQAEAVRIGAQARRGFLVPKRPMGLPGSKLPSCASTLPESRMD